MNEELLSTIWEFGLFNSNNLRTTDNQSIEIVEPGHRNALSGPDFSYASIRLGDLMWSGNVELHVRASDWIVHNHTSDPAYHNIILHVVYEADVLLDEHAFRNIPTLELKAYLPLDFKTRYKELLQQKTWIACEDKLKSLKAEPVLKVAQELAVERLKRKAVEIGSLLHTVQGDWEQAFIIWIARSFGFKSNASGFEILARNVRKTHLVNSENIEALLLGMAGLLPDSSNDYYVLKLIEVFQYEQAKWKLKPIPRHLWKRGGVRPANQPEIKIAQLASFLKSTKQQPLAQLFVSLHLDNLISHLQQPLNAYWSIHYQLNKLSAKHQAEMSIKSSQMIMMNAILPFYVAYGNRQGQLVDIEAVNRVLSSLAPETNNLIKNWANLNVKPSSALQSQGLLELYQQKCSQKKCLLCKIGKQLLIT